MAVSCVEIDGWLSFDPTKPEKSFVWMCPINWTLLEEEFRFKGHRPFLPHNGPTGQNMVRAHISTASGSEANCCTSIARLAKQNQASRRIGDRAAILREERAPAGSHHEERYKRVSK
jgi:hypothetical protein